MFWAGGWGSTPALPLLAILGLFLELKWRVPVPSRHEPLKRQPDSTMPGYARGTSQEIYTNMDILRKVLVSKARVHSLLPFHRFHVSLFHSAMSRSSIAVSCLTTWQLVPSQGVI